MTVAVVGGRKTRAEDEGPFTYHCEVKVWRKGVECGVGFKDYKCIVEGVERMSGRLGSWQNWGGRSVGSKGLDSKSICNAVLK